MVQTGSLLVGGDAQEGSAEKECADVEAVPMTRSAASLEEGDSTEDFFIQRPRVRTSFVAAAALMTVAAIVVGSVLVGRAGSRSTHDTDASGPLRAGFGGGVNVASALALSQAQWKEQAANANPLSDRTPTCGVVSKHGNLVPQAQLNDFDAGVDSMEYSGWVFSRGFSPRFKYRPSLANAKSAIPLGDGSKPSEVNPHSYWGWDFPGNGRISLVLRGSGRLRIDYGNAYKTGVVNVRLDGHLVGTAQPATASIVASVSFKEGSTLLIEELQPRAMIVINSVEITCDSPDELELKPFKPDVNRAGGSVTSGSGCFHNEDCGSGRVCMDIERRRLSAAEANQNNLSAHAANDGNQPRFLTDEACHESYSLPTARKIREEMRVPDGFSSCAIIGSSGILLDERLGTEIDAHDMVLRFNDAPLKSYENAVGTKTTIRIMNGEALKAGFVDAFHGCPEEIVFINTGYSVGKNALRSHCEGKTVIIDHWAEMLTMDVPLKLTPKGYNIMSGSLGLALALMICPTGVDMYGFTNRYNYNFNVPYHYYDVEMMPNANDNLSATAELLSDFAEASDNCARLDKAVPCNKALRSTSGTPECVALNETSESRQEECEQRNYLMDGHIYHYNYGRGSGDGGACGVEADCWCCRLPAKSPKIAMVQVIQLLASNAMTCAKFLTIQGDNACENSNLLQDGYTYYDNKNAESSFCGCGCCKHPRMSAEEALAGSSTLVSFAAVNVDASIVEVMPTLALSAMERLKVGEATKLQLSSVDFNLYGALDPRGDILYVAATQDEAFPLWLAMSFLHRLQALTRDFVLSRRSTELNTAVMRILRRVEDAALEAGSKDDDATDSCTCMSQR